MRVKGNIASVQSNLDFYLKISSLGNIRTLQELRTYYFNIFLNEERSQARLLLKEKQELEKRKEEEIVVTQEVENGKEDLEEGNTEDIFSGSFFVCNKVEEESTEEYVAHGVYLDEIDTPEGTSVEDIENIEEDLESAFEEYEEEYREDEVNEEEGKLVKEELVKEVITPDEGYVEHGVFLDEIIINDEEDESSEEDSEEECYFEYEEVEQPIVETEEIVEDNGESLSDEDVVDDFDSAFNAIEEDAIAEDVNTPIDLEVQEPQVHLEVSKVEEPINIPSDIRVFLKQHPNSEISYVSQFYPMKEINKQIKLGRIYKKKGKLLI